MDQLYRRTDAELKDRLREVCSEFGLICDELERRGNRRAKQTLS